MKRMLFELLKPGMITGEDVYALNGQLLVPKGSVLTDTTLHLLHIYSIRSIRIDDSAEEAAPESSKEMKGSTIPGDDIPGFTSRLSEEVRQTRIQNIQEYKQAYAEGLDYFQVSINNLVAKNTDLNVDTILDQTLSLLGSKGKNSNILEMLVHMKEYDTNVYAHSMNVSLICNMMARWLEYSEEECRMAAACGLFHDIGKLAIPESIIQKPGPLTPEEREIVNTHPERGYHILEDHGVEETVRLSALMHHESCDGSGYPRKLKGDQIDRFAKMVGICDIYNAMTSDRPYRKAMSPFAVLEHFEEVGLSKFDTQMILVFLENTANTYLNCPVRLSNGQVGYVVYINKGRFGRPTVQCGDEFIDLSKRSDLTITEMLPAV